MLQINRINQMLILIVYLTTYLWINRLRRQNALRMEKNECCLEEWVTDLNTSAVNF